MSIMKGSAMFLSLLFSLTAMAQVNCQTWHEGEKGRVQISCHEHQVQGFIDQKTKVQGLQVKVINSASGTEIEKSVVTKMTVADFLAKNANYKKQLAGIKLKKGEKIEVVAVQLPTETALFSKANGADVIAKNISTNKKVDRFVASEKQEPRAGGIRRSQKK